jgi:hypothetical protein
MIGPAIAEPLWTPDQSVDDIKMRGHAVCVTGGSLIEQRTLS